MTAEPVLIAVIASFMVGFILGRATASGSSTRKNPAPMHPVEPLPADLEEKVHKLILGGKKIEAIKVVRLATGLGLKQAKDLVDGMACGVPRLTVHTHDDAMAEVRALIAECKKIEAIKLYREVSGLGLKEAKEQVEKMEKESH